MGEKEGDAMRRLIVLLLTLCLFVSPAYAHKGYHYAGLMGTAPSTDVMSVWMMMPSKPTNCSNGCHVLGWTILWDAYATGQYIEAGIGYDSASSGKLIAWYATPNKPYANKVVSLPWGAWVHIRVIKLSGVDTGTVYWGWYDGEKWRERTITASVPGWWTTGAYHPTKAEISTVKSSHPGNVTIHFAGVETFPGDNYAWNVYGDGPWLPYGDFRTFTVR
jgi:hypothetical protein